MKTTSLKIFWHLVKRELIPFSRLYVGKFVDTCFIFLTNVIVFSYFLPYEGVGTGYGPFILEGAIASFGLIEIVGKVGTLLADLDGERTISSTLIMPIRPSLVFVSIAVYWALTSLLLSLPLFPLGKLILYNRFNLEMISYWRLALVLLTTNIFFGFFSLWLTSILQRLTDLSRLWLRIISPIWMFGAYFYTWKSSFELNPLIGYISLINPMVYVMEGTRAATLGQEGYLPYWACQLVLWAFIIMCGWHAISRLKKRLDCV